jgi:isoleucyl-tRNA synthetase
MPFAQKHYPFENVERFEKTFPADFIAEGLDQTRGWFYTLMVLSVALRGCAPFKNVIVNGLVLAEDGKKMSKSLKNYPDPSLVMEKYGADAMRLYLINSPVVRAEPLKFREDGVSNVLKDVLKPWFNAYRFCVENCRKFTVDNGGKPFTFDMETGVRATKNVTDVWILSKAQSLIKFVRAEMAEYRLYTVVSILLQFIEQLTNWYIRFNRKRLKGSQGPQDTFQALCVLHFVLYQQTLLMAPFTPFFAEHLYQNLRLALPEGLRQESVHFCLIPEPDKSLIHPEGCFVFLLFFFFLFPYFLCFQLRLLL